MNFLVVTFLVTSKFKRAVRDHFVSVHVGAGTSTALNRIDNELFIELAGSNFVTSSDDCGGDIVGQFTNLLVGFCGCLFDDG